MKFILTLAAILVCNPAFASGQVTINFSGGGSASVNATNALPPGPGGIYDISLGTNVNGSAIQTGTVNSNALDAATKSILGGGGTPVSTNNLVTTNFSGVATLPNTTVGSATTSATATNAQNALQLTDVNGSPLVYPTYSYVTNLVVNINTNKMWVTNSTATNGWVYWNSTMGCYSNKNLVIGVGTDTYVEAGLPPFTALNLGTAIFFDNNYSSDFATVLSYGQPYASWSDGTITWFPTNSISTNLVVTTLSVNASAPYAGSGTGLTNVPAALGEGIPIECFGAKGDGLILFPATIASNSTALTCSDGNAYFSSNDVGKVIMIYGTNVGAACWTTTISNVVDQNNINVSSNAPNAFISVPIIYGTGDGLALQSAADYCVSNIYSLPSMGGVAASSIISPIWFTSGKIYINDHPIQSLGTNSCQIWFHSIGASFLNHPTICWQAAHTTGGHWIFPKPVNANSFRGGAIIWSTLATAPNGTNVYRSFMFGNNGNKSTPDYVNASFLNIQFLHPYDNNAITIDAFDLWNLDMYNCTIGDGYAQAQAPYYPQVGTNGMGIKLPNLYNNNEVTLVGQEVYNEYKGIDENGNVTLIRPKIFSCENAFSSTQGGDEFQIINASIQECHYVFGTTMNGVIGVHGFLNIDNTTLWNNRQVMLVKTNTWGGSVMGDIVIRVANNILNPDTVLINTYNPGQEYLNVTQLRDNQANLFFGNLISSNSITDLGTITANKFTGDGAGLTNIPASSLSGNLFTGWRTNCESLTVSNRDYFWNGLLTNSIRLTQVQDGVSLEWDEITNPIVAGYNVYYGTTSGTYTNEISAGSATNVTISGLVDGTTYYFAATTYIVAGVESPFSSEVEYQLPAPLLTIR